ncbi:uncharacterized protein si:cabz01007807.1 isoform X2 [Pimephales promelas]|uniref:uncharacterized protein si:cabz01007807.1 isoform X2 n=1 Tax=Pimephales promelas TaxID=90988 RepID=UPI0019555308|nr:uncharacterized protein si:cabz01007807.1 isoform X2 [Pimephales promelas]
MNPFCSNPQEYAMKTVDEEVLPNGIHHSPLFSDFVNSDPFAAPDWVVFPPPDFYSDNTPDVFQTTSGIWGEETDIFQPFKDKVDTDLTQSSSTNQNAESSSSANQRDPLLDFILSRQKKSEATPSFTSPFDSADVFQETSTKTESFFSNADPVFDDIFKTPSSTAGPDVSDIKAFDPLFDPQNEVQSNQKSNNDSLIGHQDVGTSDFGLQNGSVQEIPSANTSNGGLMFRRRPPKPAPRSKAPKSVRQPQNPTAEVENDLPVYEDVLLIGQERCVEDWPEHSPELSQEWKPAGKLRLRRDSVRITEASAGVDGTVKKNGKQTLGKKLRRSLLIRRRSKDKIVDEEKSSETNTHTLSLRRGSKTKHTDASAKGFPADYQDDLPSWSKTADLTPFGPKRDEDVDFTPKFKPPVLHRPQSFSKDPFSDGDLDLCASLQDKPPIAENDGDRNAGGIDDGQKHKKKVKVKFVPQRGFVIGLSKAENEPTVGTPHFKEKEREDELKGACGFTPHPHLKDQDGMDELKRMSIYTEDTSYSPNQFKSPYSSGFMGPPSKASDLFTTSDFSETQDCRPKKPTKFKVPLLHRRYSKSIEEAEIRPTKDHDEMKKPPLLKVPPLSRRGSKAVEEDEGPQKGADLFRAGDLEPEDDFGWEEYTPDNKPQKPQETYTHRTGSKDVFPEDFLQSPGATSANYYLSDAAKAEWMSSQMDMKRLKDQEEEQKHEEEEEEDGGDTDSLMEWWNTVEFWDEVTPNETISSKEEETISFKALADKVHRGLRVYLKLFMERAELLYQHVLILYGIADDLSNFHHRTKVANITGGTTTAIGGAAAITGLALAPVTFGASIIVSAIGLGIATAGGITAASASISDNINNMHDRKKIEVIVQDYETQLVEMLHCLRFIVEGLGRMRAHPLLRRNNYYTGDWEVRRALQTISLVTDPVERAEEITHNTLVKLASLHSGMDKFFTKDMKEVKKGCKKEVTAEVRSLAKQLQEGLVELNSIREQLLDATGNI